MRYFASIIILAVTIFPACKKTNNSNASVLFYNGTWSLPAIAASWNGGDIISSPIAQGESSGRADSAYLQVQAGTNNVKLSSGTTSLLDKNIYAIAGAGSSFIFFDSSIVAGHVKILQLTDDLTLPDTAQLKYRLINLVPDASVQVDTWLVGATDSVRLDTAGVFIGATAAASAVQAFSALTYHGQPYTVKVKKTGTEEIYASVLSYPFVVKGIYSIIFSGLPGGTGSTAYKLSVLQHHIP